jgi:hypothetical protein
MGANDRAEIDDAPAPGVEALNRLPHHESRALHVDVVVHVKASSVISVKGPPRKKPGSRRLSDAGPMPLGGARHYRCFAVRLGMFIILRDRRESVCTPSHNEQASTAALIKPMQARS